MEIETTNMSFKRLLIFPFQYIAEKKIETRIKTEKNISFYRLNISFIQHNAGLQLVDFFSGTKWRNYYMR